jgi:hypothetical protein
MTFSIVARDLEEKAWGVAVASKFPDQHRQVNQKLWLGGSYLNHQDVYATLTH